MISKSDIPVKKRCFYDGEYNYKGRRVIQRKVNNEYINQQYPQYPGNDSVHIMEAFNQVQPKYIDPIKFDQLNKEKQRIDNLQFMNNRPKYFLHKKLDEEIQVRHSYDKEFLNQLQSENTLNQQQIFVSPQIKPEHPNKKSNFRVDWGMDKVEFKKSSRPFQDTNFVFNGPPPPVVERKINNNNKSVDFVKRAFEVIIPNQGKNPNRNKSQVEFNDNLVLELPSLPVKQEMFPAKKTSMIRIGQFRGYFNCYVFVDGACLDYFDKLEASCNMNQQGIPNRPRMFTPKQEPLKIIANYKYPVGRNDYQDMIQNLQKKDQTRIENFGQLRQQYQQPSPYTQQNPFQQHY